MENRICLWSFKWSHLIINPEKYIRYRDRYPISDDGWIDSVWAIVKNKEWNIYLHHHAKNNEFYIPWWKIESGEIKEQALIRELKEELNIDVKKYTYSDMTKYILRWVKRRFHTFIIEEYTWIPLNNDSDEYDQYRAEIIDSDNELGFAVKVDGTITDDVQDIMQSCIDLYHLKTVVPRLFDPSVLEMATYRPYDESMIDRSKHYYLYVDISQKEYYFELK